MIKDLVPIFCHITSTSDLNFDREIKPIATHRTTHDVRINFEQLHDLHEAQVRRGGVGQHQTAG